MARKRFGSDRPYSAGELFIIGGRDQEQIYAEPGESRTADGRAIFNGYDRGNAAIDAMAEKGHDFSHTEATLEARDREIERVAEEVPQAAEIEDSRRVVADAYTKVKPPQIDFKE